MPLTILLLYAAVKDTVISVPNTARYTIKLVGVSNSAFVIDEWMECMDTFSRAIEN